MIRILIVINDSDQRRSSYGLVGPYEDSSTQNVIPGATRPIDRQVKWNDGMIDREVGLRLKALREELGLSQRLLARRAGVPSSTISLIESGKTNPSVGSLKRILQAAGSSLADFFSFDLKIEEKVFFTAGELSEISGGNISYRQVGHGKSALQILHERYRPGADSGRVMLTHEGEEGAVIIQGELQVTVGDQTRTLKAGDAYLFPSTLPHRFRNTGDIDCIVVSACTPPTF